MKKTILIIAFILLATTQIRSEIVNKITIDGNSRISDETIILFGEIEKNKDYSLNDLNEIIKKLYITDFFKNVELNIEDGNLNILIEENPIVQNLILEGIKAEKFKEKLLDVLTIKERTSYIESKLKKDISIIKTAFEENGYYFVKIDAEIKENDNNTVDLIYDIDLGKKTKISKIKFIGDKVYKDKKLLSVITSEESKFWKILSTNKFLNKQRINLDTRLLTNFYKNKGYYEVKVNNSYVNFLNNESFELIFDIDPGKKYYFNNLELSLPLDYEKENFAKVNKLLSGLSGKVFSNTRIEKVIDEIDKIALQKQYQFINAKVIEKFNDNKIDFTFKVEESEKYYVERVNILGNSYTDEKVIRNNLIIDEGDPYNKILANKSINQVKSLRIFKTVESTIKDGSSNNQKIINIEVEEMPTGEISAGAGVGTSGSSIGFGIKEKNYLGRGVTVDANLVLSDDGIKGLLSVVNPNYKNTDNSLFTTFESSSEDKLDKFGYETSKYGLSLGTRYEQYEDIFFSPNLSIYHEDLKTNSTARDNLKKQSGEYFDINASYAFLLDKRDQKYRTNEGHRTYFSQTLPIITEDGALKNSFEYKKFHKFADEMIGRISVYLETINSITDEDVRISKRSYIPSSKLRGFEPGRIGPKDGSDHVGGNYAAALNFSTDIPFLFRNIQSTDFKFFIDTANVWGVDYSDNVDGGSKIRSSTGVSVDWWTPIGPLNFTLASPITKHHSDRTETFRFNLGTTF